MRPLALLVALVISGPTVWRALVEGTVSLETALVHVLVAVPLAVLLVALTTWAMNQRRGDS